MTTRTPMTIARAAEYSGFSKPYLYKLIDGGRILSYKPDTSKQGKVILCKEELDSFLFSNRRATVSELREAADGVLNAGGRK